MGMPEILARVAEETEIYLEAGVDGLVLENMHDTPYCLEQQLGPHIGTSMAVVARQVKHFLTKLFVQQKDIRLTQTHCSTAKKVLVYKRTLEYV